MKRYFVLSAAALSFSLAGCAGMGDDDFYVGGPVAPPYKGDPQVYVPVIDVDRDFMAAAGTNTVFFDTDESTITPQARDTLKRQLAWLITHREIPVIVEGHADERATDEYNLKLAQRRADAVKNFFMAGGIPEERITAETFGESSPVIDEYGDIQVNRRVVTIVGERDRKSYY